MNWNSRICECGNVVQHNGQCTICNKSIIYKKIVLFEEGKTKTQTTLEYEDIKNIVKDPKNMTIVSDEYKCSKCGNNTFKIILDNNLKNNLYCNKCYTHYLVK